MKFELLHLLANSLHANGLPDLHKVATRGANLFDVPTELVVHLCKDVCYPVYTGQKAQEQFFQRLTGFGSQTESEYVYKTPEVRG